ncbi:hypothetical protein HDU87_007136 [Geranomyces variabilis]|uniref:Elongin-A n=1 Tax=Geranomyces variabilis TaxID=109894 RepID=A0AAD5TFP2_9FUNG|nr:hypothetical protein HDU87_007136 [Geranomyces variabilis]
MPKVDANGYEMVEMRNPESLATLCLKQIDRRLHSMQTFARVPYYLVKDLLAKCKPAHLMQLEKTSLVSWCKWHALCDQDQLEFELTVLRLANVQNLLPDSSELWKAHVLMEWAEVRRKYEQGIFDEPDDWREYYIEHRAQDAERIRRVGLEMRRNNALAAAEKEARQVIKINGPLALSGRNASSGSGWGKSNKRSESSIMSKARKDAKKLSKHFEPVAQPVKHRAPTTMSMVSSSSSPASSGLKRTQADSFGGSSSMGPPAAKRAKAPPPFKSKAMSSLVRVAGLCHQAL